MTSTGKALAVVYALACVFAVSMGGQFIAAGRTLHIIAAYTVAALCAIGLVREVARAIPPGDYTDDEPDPEPVHFVGEAYEPGRRVRRMSRLRAGRAARRELRRQTCDCPRFWTSLGSTHDDWCPRADRSAA
ncbi:hypothetical protein GR925_25840 [Streptomyces sp. HUCO-GS316]|uniref:hypothetical protein n=1 Tax=Streptomyces sp. HUCO-GS316 TaxID=2692198 RepID=UPI0013688055|nr:hypothetical protein [Streptomyces sp. HUCO-GS316]MXM66759.1 hypothetical protein [Streptomyces sp. HUCO-GS316]